ncbi:MAG: hypothetical protein AAF218_06690 [Pseudomonadota bacterium]
MTAPDTNIDKQTKRHFPPLLGIALAVIAAVAFVMLVPLVSDEEAEAPVAADTQ